MVEQRELAVPEQLAPLVSADQARALWEEYRRLETAVLEADDYLWFVEWQEGQKRQRRAYGDEEEARTQAERVKGRVLRRKKKSAYMKMARLFKLEVPTAEAPAQIEASQVGPYLVVKESGTGYTLVTWLNEELVTVKASATVTVRDPRTGRTWLGRGGAHQQERGWAHQDHDVAALAWTRAVNRAVSYAVGWGEESAEEEGEGQNEGGAQEAPARQRTSRQAPPGRRAAAPPPPPAPAQDPLRQKMADLANSLGWTPQVLADRYQQHFATRLSQGTRPSNEEIMRWLEDEVAWAQLPSATDTPQQ